jgi:ribonuclease HI
VKDESQIPNPQSRSGSGIVAFIDGGARGNPGPAGYGVRIEDELGAIITEFNGFLGASTNNVAEYNGLVAALKYAQQHGHRVVRIKSDSELLVKQMRGEYRVKHQNLKPLYAQARTIAEGLERVVFEHVRREQNKDADRLANLAMDQGTKTTS